MWYLVVKWIPNDFLNGQILNMPSKKLSLDIDDSAIAG